MLTTNSIDKCIDLDCSCRVKARAELERWRGIQDGDQGKRHKDTEILAPLRDAGLKSSGRRVMGDKAGKAGRGQIMRSWSDSAEISII